VHGAYLSGVRAAKEVVDLLWQYIVPKEIINPNHRFSAPSLIQGT
jgi:hypothetical protein